MTKPTKLNYGEKILWDLLGGCVSRDEVFGGCNLSEYAEALIKAHRYFFPDTEPRYDTKLNVDGKIITIRDLK